MTSIQAEHKLSSIKNIIQKSKAGELSNKKRKAQKQARHHKN